MPTPSRARAAREHEGAAGADAAWRVAFAVDPEREVILRGGDKSGVRERRLDRTLIAEADERSGRHLDGLEERHEDDMALSLDKLIGSLPQDEQAGIAARADELRAEVATLKELRALSGMTQTKVARALGIKQPAVSKVERQTDLYLSTLRSYVEAIGGELELIVKLPGQAPMRLDGLSGDEANSRVQQSVEGRLS